MGTTEPQQPGVLGRLRDQSRPVIVFGPAPDDPRLRRQGHSWVGALPEAGIKDRDIVVVEVVGAGEGRVGGQPLSAEEARQLRAEFGVGPGDFAVVLVGRDGAAKERWSEPVSAHEIFGKVDAMPMREREVQAKGGGSE